MFEGSLVAPRAPFSRRALAPGAAALIHAGGLAAALLFPLLTVEPLPEPAADLPGVVVFHPPPAAAPPLPRGSPVLRGLEPTRIVRVIEPESAGFTAPDTRAQDEPVPREETAPAERFGTSTGSEAGTLEGMEDGVDGGLVGGGPGGDPGGCVGCTGDVPVRDYDQPARAIVLTRPTYPHDAFIKKIEGEVVVEFVIGLDGGVGNVRVVRSVPMLDRAAIETVRQWRFTPAVRRGRAVPSLATAPVRFRIF